MRIAWAECVQDIKPDVNDIRVFGPLELLLEQDDRALKKYLRQRTARKAAKAAEETREKLTRTRRAQALASESAK